jgi:hypothetical protein
MLYWVHLAWAGFELTTLAVIDTDCTGNWNMVEISDINLSLMQILASDKIQEYVLKQMLIRTVQANNVLDITVSIPF